MSSLIVVCDDSYPRRIYYCKCLLHTVDRIYHANLCSYVEILRGGVDFIPSNIDFVFAKYIVGGRLYSFTSKTYNINSAECGSL